MDPIYKRRCGRCPRITAAAASHVEVNVSTAAERPKALLSFLPTTAANDLADIGLTF